MEWHDTSILILVCIAILRVACLGGEMGLDMHDANMNMGQFCSSGQFSGENGQNYSWMMLGDSAIVRGRLYVIDSLTLTIERKNGVEASAAEGSSLGGGNAALERVQSLQLQSLRCEYNQAGSELRSSAPIFIKTDGMEARGIGYDVFLKDDEVILIIRSAVKIVLHDSRLDKLTLEKGAHSP